MPTTTTAFKLAAMAAMKEADQPLETPTLILIGTPFDEGVALKAADYTELSVTGYSAHAALVFGTPYIGSDSTVRMTAPSVEFRATADVADKVAYGWAVVDSTKAVVHYAKRFDNPVSFSQAGRGVVVDPEIKWAD